MNYDQRMSYRFGFYLVADGSNEYRSYQQDLDEYRSYFSENEPEYKPEYDYWFDYDLMPNKTYQCLWCMGKFGDVEHNPNFDQHDGNF